MRQSYRAENRIKELIKIIEKYEAELTKTTNTPVMDELYLKYIKNAKDGIVEIVRNLI